MKEIIQKLCLLGEMSTGKMQIVKPVVYSMFDDRYITTIGTKVTKKTLDLEIRVKGEPLQVRDTLLIWDILGQKQYSRLHPVYFQAAEGALVVCALDRPTTVESIPVWIRQLTEVVGEVPIGVLANCGSSAAVEGADLAPVRAVVDAHVPIFPTSVETPERTDAAFSWIAPVMAERFFERQGKAREEALTIEMPRRRFRLWKRKT